MIEVFLSVIKQPTPIAQERELKYLKVLILISSRGVYFHLCELAADLAQFFYAR